MFENIREDDPERLNAKKLLEAKIKDQYQFAISKNKITHTDFLNRLEKSMAEKFIKQYGMKNYLFFGGNGEDSERNILLFYPDKFSREMVEKNLSKILSAIRISLPKGLSYEHRIYLSGILKLGIKREKIGDILVRENGADMIILQEVQEFLKNHLRELTRFQKANCDVIDIEDVKKRPQEFEDLSIVVSSMRLDNFVAELARCSRTKAIEMIEEQRVLVNYALEAKFSKKINRDDVITVRGKGKFIVQEMDHQTRSGKYVICMKKFV